MFEPAAGDGDVVVARRGRCVVNIASPAARPTPAAIPWNGRSAVAALAELILAADAMSARADDVSVNVGRVEGGGAVNVVPANARAELDVRAPTAAAPRRGGGAPGRRGPGGRRAP